MRQDHRYIKSNSINSTKNTIFSLKLGEVPLMWTQSCSLAWRNFGLNSEFDRFTCKNWFQHFHWVKIKTLPCPFQNVIFLLRCLAGLQFLDRHLDIFLQKTCQIRPGFTYKTKVLFWTPLSTNHSFNSLLAVHVCGFQPTLDWQQC